MVHFFSSPLCAALLFSTAQVSLADTPLSISELEQTLQTIDAELHSLAQISLNSGVGPIGYRSNTYPSAERPVSIRIDLGAEFQIDEIILVPTLWRDIESGFVSDSFPEAFKVFAGTASDPKGLLVAEFNKDSDASPGIGPLIIPASGTRASWIEIKTSRLSPRAFDKSFILQLAEIMVFQGDQNIALHKPVTPSKSSISLKTWRSENLVDGILPYLMNAANGPQSRALVIHGEGQPMIEIDLGEVIPLSGIRLHSADQSDTVPQGFSGDFGLPRRFKIEGAKSKNFSDSRVLLQGKISSIYEVGPMMDWQFLDTPCRYVRLVATEPYISTGSRVKSSTIAFAEIELHSRGQNIALGKPVSSNFPKLGKLRNLSSLTDGNNLYGEILPLRKWLNQLARRHTLETRRPLVVAQLTDHYARQKKKLRLTLWLITALILGIGFLILYYRQRSRRQESRIRERISANLHDNLGANLHAIGLLGDLAKEAVHEPKELIDTVDRIRRLTERTGRAARDCANMIEASDVCQDLVAEMKRDSMSFLADLDHELFFQGEEFLEQLSRRRRIDLFLFYKEALTNVIRHSGATAVKTSLTADAQIISLTVTDNGQGYQGECPPSLQRRAKLLGAQPTIHQAESGGTCVALTLKTRKFNFSS